MRIRSLTVHQTDFDSLGLGDEKRVAEEEEVSLLGLQASLQLGAGVTQEEAAGTLGQEGLDQGTGLGADRDQAALPVGQEEGESSLGHTNDSSLVLGVDWTWDLGPGISGLWLQFT